MANDNIEDLERERVSLLRKRLRQIREIAEDGLEEEKQSWMCTVFEAVLASITVVLIIFFLLALCYFCAVFVPHATRFLFYS